MKMKGKSHVLISILALSMYLNIEYVVSLFLADISADFPSASVISVQNVYSVIFLVELLTQLSVSWFTARLSKRKIVICFQGFTIAGGLIAWAFGTSMAMLYLSSVMIGFAAAIISTISKSLILENFTGEDVPKVLAAQQIAQAIGTIVLQLVAGWLAVRSWRLGYLTFLFGLASLLSGIFLLPEGPVENHAAQPKQNRPKLWNRHLLHDVLVTGLFGVIFCAYNYNISYLVVEKELGNTAVTGTLASVLTASAFVAALVFPTVERKTGKYLVLSAFGCVFFGYIMIALSSELWFIVVGICLVGFGQGLFSPAIYINVSKYAKALTASVAMVNMGAAIGMYLYPYMITAPATLFGDSAATRFLFAAACFIPIMLYELRYCTSLSQKSV